MRGVKCTRERLRAAWVWVVEAAVVAASALSSVRGVGCGQRLVALGRRGRAGRRVRRRGGQARAGSARARVNAAASASAQGQLVSMRSVAVRA